MPHTTVTSAPERAKEGLLYDAQGAADALITGIVEEANGIKPGRLVVRGSSDFQCSLPAGAGSLGLNVLGVSAFTHKALVNPSSSDNEVYENETSIPLVRDRRMWVRFEDAFDPTDSVFVRVATGAGGTEIGRFRTDADTATAVAFAAARILTSGAAGELGVIEVDL